MRKSEDELRNTLNATANEISHVSGNPRSWLSWLTYLLVRLEDQAINENQVNLDSFKELLEALQDEIRNRLRTGGW